MAIIPWLKGLVATIKVDDRTATEFNSPEAERAPQDMKFHRWGQPLGSGDPYVVKYIEVKPGARFSFHTNRSTEFEYHGGFQIGMIVEVDGKIMEEIQTENHRTSKTHQTMARQLSSNGVLEGSHARGWQRRPFRFSNLDIVEDGVPAKEIKEQILQAKNLGCLRIYCYRLKESTLSGRPVSELFAADPALKATSKMSEKALKGRALDCRAGLGEGVRDVGFGNYRVTYEDPERRPFAVFEFRYRSLEGLYKEGIIPRPDPTAGPSVIDGADAPPADGVDAFALPEAEAREMLQRLLESRRNESRIKPEKSGGGSRDDALEVGEGSRVKSEASHGVKRERSGTMEAEAAFLARYKGRKLPNGRIEVDLTDD
ncbi:hypothetical protein QBC39DRAFT_356318 [Podospora conica]|nr:hypothetical protein QBC39DRAFT_356318 [Schizothecium conicum]